MASSNLKPPCVKRAVSVVLAVCLLATSTPAAPQTILALAKETRVSFAFWFRSGGLGRLIQVRGPNPRRQQTQAERDAKVTRIEIFPKNATVELDSRVRFSAVAYDADGNSVGGVKIKWSAQNVTLRSRAPISSLGEFRGIAAGSFSVSAEAAGRSAQVSVVVRPGLKPNLNLPPIGTRNVSTRALAAATLVSSARTEEPRVAVRSSKRTFKNRDRAAEKRSHAHATTNPLSAPMLPGDGWDETNYQSADDPGNRIGDPPGSPMDGGAGSGNFQFAAPIYSAAGRGINISLGAAYNSRLWNKAGNQLTYDIDRGWPAPGFNLGFGKLLGMTINSGCMLVDADGTRHAYDGTITFYNWGTYGVMHTTDGSFIDYTYWTGTNGVITSAQAKLPNGTVINYGAYSQAGGGVFPTSIEDANGNFIIITYVNNTGPRIQTVTDTLGRVINFHYDYNNLLTAITAPGLSGGTRTLVRFQYQQLNLAQYPNYGFNGSVSAAARDSYPWVLRAIYYPGTGTGYWFGDSDSYSSYGMIAKVVEQRGMGFSGAPLNEQGDVTQGSVTRRETYSYPLSPDSTLTDAPTYGTMQQEWTRDGSVFDSATTSYAVNLNSTPRTTTITLPNGIKNTQYSYNYSNLPDTDPLKALDGLVYQDETYVTPGNILQSSTSTWQKGAYDSPRPLRVTKTNELGQTTAAEFSYDSGVYNQVTDVRDYGYSGELLRSTRTSYQNSVNYTGTCYSSGCIGRHIFNLPLTVEVYAADNVTRVSRTDYQYDGQTLTAAPGVTMHSQASNPHADAEGYCSLEPDWNDPDCAGTCLPNCHECIQPPGCDGYCPQIYNCPYNPATDYRGNVTQVTTYADAINLTAAVTETRRYDVTGNVVSASSSCCEQTSFTYTIDTQYTYLQAQTSGSASDPYQQVTTSATYDFNTGLTLSTTDADGRSAQTSYWPETLRPQTKSLASGAHTDFAYNESAMTVSETTYLESHPTHTTITHQNVKYLNGQGQVRQERSRGPDINQIQTWDAIDTVFNNLGQIFQQSAPYRVGSETPVLSIATYDSLGRTTRVTGPDGSVTETYYNEQDFDPNDSYTPTRPGVASSAPGETTLVRDAWGRERWSRTDAQGRLVELVEPNPSGNGSVATNGMVTSYSYDTLDGLTEVTQGSQTRSFKYDSLGRLAAQKLAEVSPTLNDAGTYVGVGGPGAQWGDVFTYDERSNLTSRTDARGVRTVYNYNNDPLNRLQSVSWDTSGFGDTANPILPAPTVTYQYRQKSSGSQLIDITDLSSITTTGVSSESYGYDAEGRIASKSLIVNGRPSMDTNYSYDSLDRIIDVTYPRRELGVVGSPRKVMHHDYDIASRLSGLTYDGQSFASNIVYNAASQTTSLNVGTGANQITESYGYNAQTGLLENQTVVRGGTTTLLNLSYDYLRAGTTSGRTGQLTKILNNLNHNKDRGYSYDALGRLVQATGGPATAPIWTQAYSYDRYGNRTSVNASGYSAKLSGSSDSQLAQDKSAIGNRQSEITKVSEPRAVATGSNTQPSTPSPNLLARNEVAPLLGTGPTVKGSEPLSDSPPTLYTPAAQSGPPTFTDDPLVAGSTIIKALHITELRNAINTLRQQRGLAAYSWQYSVTTNDFISANPIIEMRTALDQALGPPAAPGYAGGLSQYEPVLAVHIQELRDRVEAGWSTSSQIPRDGHASISYDATSNRIINAGWHYDAAGNQTRTQNGAGWQRFQYDAANRLVKVKNDSEVTIVSYTYGPDNRRLISQEGDESSDARTYYATHGNAVIAEYSETSSSPSVPQWSKSYVYLGGRLLSTLTPNGAGGDVVQYHHPDRLGTRLVTNPAAGTSFEQVTLPFGTALNAESTGTTNRRFTSYDRSGTTGLDYAVNRHYDPQQGRFTQVDPIGAGAADIHDPQSWNMYAYVGNDPVNQTDPSGLFFKKFFKWLSKALKWIAIAAMVASLVISVVGMVIGPAALKVFLTTTLLGKALAFVASIPTLIGNFISGIPNMLAGIFGFAEKGAAIIAGLVGNAVLLGGSVAAGALSEHLADKETGKGRRRREKAERRRQRETRTRRPPVRLPPNLPEIRTEPQQGKPEVRVPPKPQLPTIDPEQPRLPDNATRGQKVRFAIAKILRIWGQYIKSSPMMIMMDPAELARIACDENPRSEDCRALLKWLSPEEQCKYTRACV